MGQGSGRGGGFLKRYKLFEGAFNQKKQKEVEEKLMKFPSERFQQLFHAVSPARRLPVIIHSAELVNDL